MGGQTDTPTEKHLDAHKKPRKDKSKKVPKPSKKPKLPGLSVDNKTRRKKPKQTYVQYIYKVLKQVHPECSISKRGMNIMNSFMNDLFDKITTESTKLIRTSKRKTLCCREVETSVRLLLPGELSQHAVSEGTKAVEKYNKAAPTE